jgi:ribosomal protein S18 acetylase RimI-like enzyme
LFDDPAVSARGLSVRATGREDAPFLRTLFETARPDAAFLAAWPEDTRRAFLDQQFQFQCIHYARAYADTDQLIIRQEGEPIGRMILARSVAEWCVVDIALLPSRRGQGIGTLLLERIKAAAAQAEAPYVRLSVDVRNPARRLYERLGFAVVEEGEGLANVEMAWRAPAPAPAIS